MDNRGQFIQSMFDCLKVDVGVWSEFLKSMTQFSNQYCS